MKKGFNIILGLCLVAIGVILGLNVLHIADINIFFDGWWTLFIFVPCIYGLLFDKNKIIDVFGIIVATILLLSAQGIINDEVIWQLVLITALILFGLNLIFGGFFKKNLSKKIKELNKNNTNSNECVAVFSGQEYTADKDFKGATFKAIFGGVDADLEDIDLKDDIVLNCVSIFGGIELKLPEGVKVEIDSKSVFGGVEDDRKKKDADKDAKTIYINANTVFGGIDIK